MACLVQLAVSGVPDGGKPRTADRRLVAGPGVYICAECIALCNEILSEEAGHPAA